MTTKITSLSSSFMITNETEHLTGEYFYLEYLNSPQYITLICKGPKESIKTLHNKLHFNNAETM